MPWPWQSKKEAFGRVTRKSIAKLSGLFWFGETKQKKPRHILTLREASFKCQILHVCNMVF